MWMYLEVSAMFAFSVQQQDRGRASQQRDMIWEEVIFSFSTPNPMIHRNTVGARMRGLERDKQNS